VKDIILIATEEEAPTMATWDNVFVTGIGKVNAAYTTTKILHEHNPERVWNFGTAGATRVGKYHSLVGHLVGVGWLEQYDMDCSALDLGVGATPGEPYTTTGRIYTANDTTIGCGTADQFTHEYVGPGDISIVDMEAYAIAKCIYKFHKDLNYSPKFYCYKYVSNAVDADGGDDWQQNISAGEQYYMEAYERQRKQM
jgi:adenosylhomocysteine nucleosidase